MLNHDVKPKEVDVSKPVPMKDLGDNLAEGDTIPLVGIFVNHLYPIQTCNTPKNKPKELVKFQNDVSILFL